MFRSIPFRRLLSVLTILMVLPVAFPLAASAQDRSWCSDARDAWANNETELNGYDIVELTGGAGSQIVLGPDEGGAYLSGGSGNDVLCARGTGNILDGGSGNDLLFARADGGNSFIGGSGNDTMIGNEEDIFDGGSGRNTIHCGENDGYGGRDDNEQCPGHRDNILGG